MTAVCVTVDDVFAGRQRARAVTPGVPLHALAAAAAPGPLVLCVNGTPVLRRDWDQPVLAGQVVQLVRLPAGGDSRDVLRLVATIALVYVIGPAALNLQGWQYAAAFAVGQFAIASLLPPDIGGAGGGPESSPTYSVGFRGNTARLKQSIPVRYGYGRWYPDHAAQPYYTYADDEQYLHLLLCIGQGEHRFDGEGEGHFLDDTPLSEFEDISWAVIEPGDLGTLTLVEPAMISAAEVSGQEMLTDEVVGPFTVCGRGQRVTKIYVDVAWPKGLYPNKTTEWDVYAQPIDEYDTPTGPWVTLGSESRTADTTTVLRSSYEYTVDAGRYRVRLIRTDLRTDDIGVAHDQIWIGLRGLLQSGDIDDEDCTYLEVRARASKQLSGASSSRFNSIGTRKLPVYNGSTWSSPQATRSIVWAFCDAHRNDVYGLGWPDSRLDLDALLDLDTLYTSRGDTFDYSFDSRRAFLDAARLIARAGRAGAIYRMGVASMVRDGAQTLPVAVFNMTNIEDGSFGISYRVLTSDTPDGVEVTYWDSIAQEERTFDALPLPLSGLTTSDRPEEVMLAGVTERTHADRERRYIVAEAALRPLRMSFTASAEGLRCGFLDLIALHHDALPDTQGGRTIAWDSTTRTLTLSEIPVFATGEPNYIAFSDDEGDFVGPYECTPGAERDQVVLAEAPTSSPLVEGLDEERSKYVFGRMFYAVVKAVEPAGDRRVRITCVNHDPAVHTADEAVIDAPYDGGEDPDYEEPASPTANITLNDRRIDGVSPGAPAPGWVRYIVRANGTVRRQTSGGTDAAFSGEWTDDAGQAASYDVRVDPTLGTLTSGTTGTWLRLDADRAYYVEEAAEFGLTQVTLRVRIRNAVTFAVKADATINLFAFGPTPGG